MSPKIFASGAEAVGYFYGRGFTETKGPAGSRWMKNGSEKVEIRYAGFMTWEAIVS